MSKQITLRVFFKRACSMAPSLLIGALVLVTGLTASALAWLAPTGKVPPTAVVNKADAAIPAPAVPQEEGARVIVVTVRPGWMEPSELTLPEGEYWLVVQNRTGRREATFRLDSDGGSRLLEVREPRRPDWRRRLNLSTGGYTLTEANHPDWVCRISITAR